MSIETEYVKSLYVENVLNLLHFTAPVDCIFYRLCTLEFTSRLRERKNNSVSTKNKILARNKYIDPKVPFSNIFT